MIVVVLGRGRSARHVHAHRRAAERKGRRGDGRRRTDTAGARQRDRGRELAWTTRSTGERIALAARPSTASRRRHARPPLAKRLASADWRSTRSARSTSGSRSSSCSRSGCRRRSRHVDTAKQILNSNAITGLAALAITIPLAARVFDLSFAFMMTLTGVVVAKLVIGGMPLVLAVLRSGSGSASAIGLINAGRRRDRKIDSFIGTLATGSLIQALITMVTNDTPISDAKLAGGFSKIGQTDDRRRHAARLLLRGRRARDLVPARAHGDRPAALRDRLQPGRGAARRRAGRPAALPVARDLGRPRGRHRHRARLDPRQRLADGRHRPTCCRRSPPCSSARRSSRTAASTPAARSSPSCCSAPGRRASALAAAPQWSQAMFVGIVLIAALAVTGIQRRTAVASRGSGVHGAGVSGTDQPGVSTSTSLTDED